MARNLTPRQGKVLRYVVFTTDQPVTPSRCVVKTEWSDLPHNDMEARKALNRLQKLGLVERVGKNQYAATESGKEVLKYADKEKRWRKPPPPSVTNQPRKDQ